MSERGYWLILVLSLVCFVSLVWFVLIPSTILDNALGTDLISESVGILFTIVFLIWILDLRDKAEWEKVRKRVYHRIRATIVILFRVMLVCIEGGITMDQSDLPELIQELKQDVHLSEIGLSLLLRDRRLMALFVESARKLNDVETKYSKFLSAEIVSSLMGIQDALYGLENSSNIYLSMQKVPLHPSPDFDFNALCQSMVQTCFANILEEMLKLGKSGIELSLPYAPS